jgi:transposase
MDYFAGLDISMDETYVCVLDREGAVVYESKSESTAQAVANELTKAPSCRRIVFETGRMAPILFHGLSQLGLPVVCVESRQARPTRRSNRWRPTRPTATMPAVWPIWLALVSSSPYT